MKILSVAVLSLVLAAVIRSDEALRSVEAVPTIAEQERWRSSDEALRSVAAEPTAFLERIEKQIRTTDRNNVADRVLGADLQALAYAINQDIIAASSPTWLNPSSERREVIAKWAERLTPYIRMLVDLALGDGFGTSAAAKQSRSVLDFAPATPVFAEQVRPFLKRSIWVAFAAADVLYEHRLLNEGDRKILREARPPGEKQAELERWALGVSSFEMTEGLEVAKSCLASGLAGDSPENIIQQYRMGLEVANMLGAHAAILLPELELIIANPAIKNAGYLGQFEFARDVVSGKKARQGRAAVNGSGPLGSWFETGLQPTQGTSPAGPEHGMNGAGVPAVKSARSLQVDEPAWPTAKMIVSVIVVAGAALLWLLLKRRS